MKTRQVVLLLTLALVLIFTAGCGGGSNYTLECDIDTDHYGWRIDGEEGAFSTKLNRDVTQSSEYDPDGHLTAIKVEVDETRTYEESGNVYVFVGEINLDVLDDTVSYFITVTGETLAEAQTCQQ